MASDRVGSGDDVRRAHDDHPPFRYPDYKSTMARSPERDMVTVLRTLSERTGPGPAWSAVEDDDADLTTNAGTGGRAIGARIVVTGRVLDAHGAPVPDTLVEIWQANAAGRYTHWRETEYDAPLDPNFLGVGQCHTDADGIYEFLTIRPGPYPWGNHPNAWRPAHVHLSLLGPALGSRLVTQLYFAGDPMLELDPIYCSAPPHSRHRMLAHYDHDVSVENWATGWRFDIVLAGEHATPGERQDD
ncbi:protocatechuate 3,4-dioxygenase subunit beta [Salsipaludibacter albus]|uniref:protocatechuate 3,4-dioxygenase subunit beta n=1 Tax=Salsipaludibacter albus TaxID=2849650 RepID=UPI001EE3DAD1|nr:protocatechuate 3,4-dioxygenase subunit beta [Salsipaludibacter albus]MBY5164253.1 protocatechuate 3,4-dioxygenase subunit beta [Salsipaludibacter albus]